MKKFLTIVMSLSLLLSVAITPVYAAGGKNHGSEGQGSTGSDGQGETTQNSRD